MPARKYCVLCRLWRSGWGVIRGPKSDHSILEQSPCDPWCLVFYFHLHANPHTTASLSNYHTILLVENKIRGKLNVAVFLEKSFSFISCGATLYPLLCFCLSVCPRFLLWNIFLQNWFCYKMYSLQNNCTVDGSWIVVPTDPGEDN